MIIVLKNADFSQSNIGTLSTWRISRSLGAGATYEGPTSVDKDAALSATVTLAEGYEIGAAGVTITMGGSVLSGAHSISGNVITITIASVTGNVLIKVPTVNTAGGDEPDVPVEPDIPDEPDVTTFTIKPTPSNANVILYDEVDNSVYSTGETSIIVEPGTIIWYMVEAPNHAPQDGRITINETKTSNIALVECDAGTNIPLTWYKSQFYQTSFHETTTPTDEKVLKHSMDRIYFGIAPNVKETLADQFWCTQVFTKVSLPNGSVISIKDGYQYRPEGIANLDNWHVQSERPVNVTDATVTINDSWWGSLKYRGFSISKTDGSSLTDLSENDLNSIFSIKLPE